MSAEPDTSVALHIGAHRTATTHLQELMVMNADLLQRNGVTAFGPSYLRRPGQDIETLFGLAEGAPTPPDGADRVRRLSAGRPRLVLSEENFIGSVVLPSGQMRAELYPFAEARLAALAEAIAPVPLDVFLAIRNPADWIASCYSQVLLSGRTLSPALFFLDLERLAIDWVGLVRRLRAVPVLRTIGVWVYESYPGTLPEVSQMVLRRQISERFVEPQERSNPGLSEAAIAAVLDRDTPMTAIEARLAYPVGPQMPRFDPVPPEVRSQIAALYAAQQAEIAALPGVQLIA